VKPYSEVVEALIQAAIRYETARREHERAVSECQRVRGQLPPGVPVNPRQVTELEAAMALERYLRDELSRSESAYKAAAKVIADELEQRATAASSMVPQ
jgi:hypothetical protein